MRIKNLLCISTLALPLLTFSQNVEIPDVNFKNYLLSNSAINTNEDEEIQLSEALSYTGAIQCESLNITSLVGIEAFTAITALDCYDNQLISLDVSQNTALIDLYLDNNEISSLDISNNIALKKLGFGRNNITSIDLSNNPLLRKLISNHNQLTSLDLSNNPNIESVGAMNNLLTSVNLKNGANEEIIQMSFTGNPNLTCIQVDNQAYSENNWLNAPNAFAFDENVQFAVNCSATANVSSINDNQRFSQLYPNPAVNMIYFTSTVNIEIYSYTGQNIASETSITKFDLSDYQEGVYFINLEDTFNKTSKLYKFIKK